ncbi:hypothetical protein Ato02nite_060190 [Paractinoplanes toevensis]|uniref:Pvc16 N-terminal domain-containing protein n=2 Tax=Paractinoplanes toevensis TaxID=571911 RepID=A0A919THW4_9ACTN|nr:hypothetical protein Ato02nite_060190 [Actinoplanes toevensis]
MLPGMAGYQALASVARSLVELLDRRIGEVLPGGQRRPAVQLVTSDDLDKVGTPNANIQIPAVALYCYRVSVDGETRAGWSAVSTADGVPHLPLRMHILVFAFDNNVEFELAWLGLTARLLESEPILTGPMLHTDGEWTPGEAVQIVTDNLSLDTMSEAFQALITKYRLCLPYVARVIMISGARQPTAAPVSSVGAGL